MVLLSYGAALALYSTTTTNNNPSCSLQDVVGGHAHEKW